jgi:hypothetical protein
MKAKRVILRALMSAVVVAVTLFTGPGKGGGGLLCAWGESSCSIITVQNTGGPGTIVNVTYSDGSSTNLPDQYTTTAVFSNTNACPATGGVASVITVNTSGGTTACTNYANLNMFTISIDCTPGGGGPGQGSYGRMPTGCQVAKWTVIQNCPNPCWVAVCSPSCTKNCPNGGGLPGI